jgi:NADPH2:quinone reductase
MKRNPHDPTVRTVVIRTPGGPDVMQTIEQPLPSVAAGQIRIQTRAMGVSRPDVLIRKGVYSWMPPLPASPGNELTGIVDAVGAGVEGLRPGEAVLLSARDLPVRGGCYTEAICVPANAVYSLPDGADLDKAVVLPTYLVAYAMLHDMGARHGAKSVFISGAAGGIGGALVELCKGLGLVVIGSVGSDEKGAHALSLGASHVVNYRTEPLVDKVMEITRGRGVDLVFDHVIASSFADLLEMLADFGTLVFYNVHTPMPRDDVYARMRDLSTRSPALRCFNIHTYDRHPEQRRRLMSQVIELFAQGKINPRVGACLPMSAAAEAHKMLEAGAVIGKIVLHP